MTLVIEEIEILGNACAKIANPVWQPVPNGDIFSVYTANQKYLYGRTEGGEIRSGISCQYHIGDGSDPACSSERKACIENKSSSSCAAASREDDIPYLNLVALQSINARFGLNLVARGGE